MPLQIRRGTNAERLAMTQPLASGELVYVTDDQRLFIGNGTTAGGVQITGYTDADAKDAAAASFTAGTHSGITFSYDTLANTMSATVDLSNYSGSINVAAVKGSVFADDSTLLVDGVAGRIVGPVYANVTGNVYSNSSTLLVDASLGRIVGPVYANVTGDVTGNVTGDLTGNSSGTHTGAVSGNVTGNLTGNVHGDVNGSVFGEDSTVLVDGTSSLIVGNVRNSQVYTSEVRAGSTTSDGIIRTYNVTTNFTEFSTITGTGTSAWIDIQSSRGTLVSPTATQNTDLLSGLLMFGHNGTSYKRSVVIGAQQDAAITNNEVPGAFVVNTMNSTGTADNQLTFDSKGVLNIPVVSTTVYSVAGTPLPSAATAGVGARAFVSDATSATFGTTYTGSSTNKVPVYSDGTNWKIG